MATALQEAILDLDAARTALAAHGIALPPRDGDDAAGYGGSPPPLSNASMAAMVLTSTAGGAAGRNVRLPPLQGQ